MATYVALLRAVNVGGHNKVPMAELRELLDELGFSDVVTYIQSGNIVCSSRKKSPGVAKAIAAGIAERFGHDIEVLVRTVDEFNAIVDGFPYPDADPKRSGVVFLDGTYDGELDASAFAPDECTVAGAHVYVHNPERFDSKMSPAWIERQTGRIGTRRNWATVQKIQSLFP